MYIYAVKEMASVCTPIVEHSTGSQYLQHLVKVRPLLPSIVKFTGWFF